MGPPRDLLLLSTHVHQRKNNQNRLSISKDIDRVIEIENNKDDLRTSFF